MTPSQIEYVKSLDPNKRDGTIQSFIMSNPNLQEVQFESFMKSVLNRILQEKWFLIENNVDLSRKINELSK